MNILFIEIYLKLRNFSFVLNLNISFRTNTIIKKNPLYFSKVCPFLFERSGIEISKFNTRHGNQNHLQRVSMHILVSFEKKTLTNNWCNISACSNIIWFYTLINMQFIFIFKMNQIIYNSYFKKDNDADIISLIRSRSVVIYIVGNISLD